MSSIKTKKIARKIMSLVLVAAVMFSTFGFTAANTFATEADPLAPISGTTVLRGTNGAVQGEVKYTYTYDWKGNMITNYEVIPSDPNNVVSEIYFSYNEKYKKEGATGTWTQSNPSGGSIQVGVYYEGVTPTFTEYSNGALKITNNHNAYFSLVCPKPTEDQLPAAPADLAVIKSSVYDEETNQFIIKSGPDDAEEMYGEAYYVVNNKWTYDEALTFQKENGEWVARYTPEEGAVIFRFLTSSDADFSEVSDTGNNYSNALRTMTVYDENGAVLDTFKVTQGDVNWQNKMPSEEELGLSEGATLDFWYINNNGFEQNIDSQLAWGNFDIYPKIKYSYPITFVKLDGTTVTVNADEEIATGDEKARIIGDTAAIPVLSDETETKAFRWTDGTNDSVTQEQLLTTAQIEELPFVSEYTFREVEVDKDELPAIEEFIQRKVYDGTAISMPTEEDLEKHIKSNNNISGNKVTVEDIEIGETPESMPTDVVWANGERPADGFTEEDVKGTVVPYTATINGEKYEGEIHLKVYPRVVGYNVRSQISVLGSGVMVDDGIHMDSEGNSYPTEMWVNPGVVHPYVEGAKLESWYAANNNPENTDTPILGLDFITLDYNDLDRYYTDEVDIYVDDAEGIYALSAPEAGKIEVKLDRSDVDNNHFIFGADQNLNIISGSDYDAGSKAYDGIEGITITADEVLEANKDKIAVASNLLKDDNQYVVRFWNEEEKAFTSKEWTSSKDSGIHEVEFKLLVANSSGVVLAEEADAQEDRTQTYTATCEIEKIDMYLVAKDESEQYGSAVPTFTLDSEKIEAQLVGDDTWGTFEGLDLEKMSFSTYYDPTDATNKNVDNYPIFVDPNGSTSKNYNFLVVTEEMYESGDYPAEYLGNLEITPAPVIITAGNYTKNEGEGDPTFGATIAGVIGTDVINYTLSRDAGETVGNYPINVSEVLDPNYVITTVPGNLEIIGAAVVPVPVTTPTPFVAALTPAVAVPLVDTPTSETIDLNEVPLAEGAAAWSLLDLILTVVTGLMSVMLLVTYFSNKREEEELEEEGHEVKKKGQLRILSLIPAIGAILLFIFTQDMTQPMIIVDEWTIVFAAIALIQGAIMFFSRKKVEEDDDYHNNSNATA